MAAQAVVEPARSGGGAMDVPDGRHFPNDLDDAAEPAGWEAEVRRAMAGAERKVLEARHAKPSIYTGSGGPAWALLHLAQRRMVASMEPRAAATEALRRLRAEEPGFDARRVTLLEGLLGSVAAQVWAHWQLGEHVDGHACAERLAALAERAAGLPEGDCEVLYGRCGVLGALLLARRVTGEAALLAAPARELVRQVVAEGKRGARETWPLCYQWHDKCYLGAAHGVAGILLTLLHLPEELAAACDGAAELVKGTAEALLAQRFESGNWPSSEGSHHDRCVHWCHGASGLVPLLVKMASFLAKPGTLRSHRTRARWCGRGGYSAPRAWVFAMASQAMAMPCLCSTGPRRTPCGFAELSTLPSLRRGARSP